MPAETNFMTDEERLIHFGIKGMRWGVRNKRPDEAERKRIFNKQTAKRVAIGVALVGGAAATAYILRKSGRTPVSELTSGKPSLVSLKGKSALGIVDKTLDPSPFRMRLDAERAAKFNLYSRISNQEITDKAWRDSARLAAMNRENKRLSLDTIRRQLEDPNHVWEI